MSCLTDFHCKQLMLITACPIYSISAIIVTKQFSPHIFVININWEYDINSMKIF